MTMALLDRGDTRVSVSPAQWLRETTAAVRVSFTWFGVRKTLTPEQKNQAAETFGAESDFLSARKKLLDTKHDAYKAVTAVRGKVIAYWKSLTLPYPEPGIRPIRQHEVPGFNEQMAQFRDELEEAVIKLPSLRQLFAVSCDFPNVEPPDYLSQLNPAIYEQEKARVAAHFEEAVRLAEQAFVSEFAKLIEHLTERLSTDGTDDRKVFRNSAITNLTEFFERFRQLNVSSNHDLDALVENAKRIVQGVEPQELRDNNNLRQHIAAQLSGVQSVLDGMLVDRPRRRIVRNQTQGG